MAIMDNDAGTGVAFLIGATIVADLVAKACSSPQTVEINAGTRATTLMKWVDIGLIEAAGFIIIAAVIDPKRRIALVSGGVLEGIVTYLQYQHAKASGLNSNEPATEESY